MNEETVMRAIRLHAELLAACVAAGAPAPPSRALRAQALKLAATLASRPPEVAARAVSALERTGESVRANP